MTKSPYSLFVNTVFSVCLKSLLKYYHGSLAKEAAIDSWFGFRIFMFDYVCTYVCMPRTLRERVET